MMNPFGGFGSVFFLVYIALIGTLIAAVYWLMRFLRQMTRVNEVKEKILLHELNEMNQSASQSSSEST